MSEDDERYGVEADIWLVGITGLELAYGGLRLEGGRDDRESLLGKREKEKGPSGAPFSPLLPFAFLKRGQPRPGLSIGLRSGCFQRPSSISCLPA